MRPVIWKSHCNEYVKSRAKIYRAFFHVNPYYAYWYGWAIMVKDLGEIKELSDTMRKTHKKEKKLK